MTSPTQDPLETIRDILADNMNLHFDGDDSNTASHMTAGTDYKVVTRGYNDNLSVPQICIESTSTIDDTLGLGASFWRSEWRVAIHLYCIPPKPRDYTARQMIWQMYNEVKTILRANQTNQNSINYIEVQGFQEMHDIRKERKIFHRVMYLELEWFET